MGIVDIYLMINDYPLVFPNIAGWKIPIFPGKYHQSGVFSMAMLVYRSVIHGDS